MFGPGEAGALGAAMLWACSSVIFSGARLTAWQINSSKNLVGCILVAATLFATGNGLPDMPWNATWMLVLSAVVGLSIGDTLYFRSLQILGARRALVVSTFIPVFGALLGWMMLGEGITFFSAASMPVAMLGIALAVTGRKRNLEAPGLYPGDAAAGILAGVAAAVCQALGGVLSKVAMEHCTALEATFGRLAAAVVVSVVVLALQGQFAATVVAVRKRENLQRILPAAAIGTWLGIWCSQIGFKYASVAVASTLQVTSPLFSIPIVWLVYGHRVTWVAFAGKLIAIVGVLMVVAGSWDQVLGLFDLADSADP